MQQVQLGTSGDWVLGGDAMNAPLAGLSNMEAVTI
ncbi:hypothetical protein LCGC14_1693510 [marine sediment metagenome]|uniref:Uncharacterized protein n=1 Tax=marine sediment metagenome TaxID=412755 RepID=A0A0F9HKM6_9ZZZZ